MFDQQSEISPESTAHTTKDDTKRVVAVIKREMLLEIHKGRTHRSFKTISSNPLIKLDRTKMDTWMHKKNHRIQEIQSVEGRKYLRH